MPMDKAAYDAKVEGRRERLEARAERKLKEGRARLKSGEAALGAIPFGQPILVGHYSEGRDRRYRERARNNISKGIALEKESAALSARAETVGTGGISSDDPTAIAQLRQQLEPLQARQALMREANKLVRKKDRIGLARLGFGAPAIDALFTPDFAGRIGYPDYQLTNNSANIRRIEARIAQLTRQAKAAEAGPVERTVKGVRIVENTEENRLQLFFPGKPEEEVRRNLKRYGFRWAPSVGAWQRQLNNAARHCAQYVVEKLPEAV